MQASKQDKDLEGALRLGKKEPAAGFPTGQCKAVGRGDKAGHRADGHGLEDKAVAVFLREKRAERLAGLPGKIALFCRDVNGAG